MRCQKFSAILECEDGPGSELFFSQKVGAKKLRKVLQIEVCSIKKLLFLLTALS